MGVKHRPIDGQRCVELETVTFSARSCQSRLSHICFSFVCLFSGTLNIRFFRICLSRVGWGVGIGDMMLGNWADVESWAFVLLTPEWNNCIVDMHLAEVIHTLAWASLSSHLIFRCRQNFVLKLLSATSYFFPLKECNYHQFPRKRGLMLSISGVFECAGGAQDCSYRIFMEGYLCKLDVKRVKKEGQCTSYLGQVHHF